MDQQHWESEDTDADFESAPHTEQEAPPETFYLALKLALARLKEYSGATLG